MTAEAAITKLMFLLGQELSKEEIKMHLNKTLCGEITE
jgi:L-asparaginase